MKKRFQENFTFSTFLSHPIGCRPGCGRLKNKASGRRRSFSDNATFPTSHAGSFSDNTTFPHTVFRWAHHRFDTRKKISGGKNLAVETDTLVDAWCLVSLDCNRALFFRHQMTYNHNHYHYRPCFLFLARCCGAGSKQIQGVGGGNGFKNDPSTA